MVETDYHKNVDARALLAICSGVPVGVLKDDKHLPKIIQASKRLVEESLYNELNQEKNGKLTAAKSRYHNLVKKYVLQDAETSTKFMPASLIINQLVYSRKNPQGCSRDALNKALYRLVGSKFLIQRRRGSKTILYGINSSDEQIFFKLVDYFREKGMLQNFMNTYYFVNTGIGLLQTEVMFKLEAQRMGMGYSREELLYALLSSPTFVEIIFLPRRREELMDNILRLSPFIRTRTSTTDLVILSCMVIDLVKGNLDTSHDELVEKYFLELSSNIIQHHERVNIKQQGGSRQKSSTTKSYRSPKKTLRKDAPDGI